MAAQLAVPLDEPSVVAGVSRRHSDEAKEKIRQTMRERWADTRYRAMVAVANLATGRWLPPMTDEQRKLYGKLRRGGATRDEALKIAIKP